MAGFCRNDAGQFSRAWTWTAAGGIRYLEVTPDVAGSIPHDIDESGRIVGQAVIDGRTHAVIWTPQAGGAYTMESVEENAAAYGIADDGRIVGIRFDEFRATLWLPGTVVAPPPPADLRARPVADSLGHLTWVSAGTETFFRARRKDRGPDGTFGPYRILGTVPAGATLFADSTVQPGGVYYYRVEACNPVGCSSAEVPLSIPTGSAAAPTDLAATLVSSRRIDLTWVNAGTGEAGFRVRRSTRAGDGTFGPYETLASPGARTTGFSDSTVVAGGVYRYYVQACNVSGCGSSAPVVATVPLPPDPPTGVTARRAGGGGEVRWTDASTTETLFRVRRSLRRADGTFGAYAPLADLPAGSVLYQDNSAAAGATYRYRVEACRTVACAGATSGPVTMP